MTRDFLLYTGAIAVLLIIGVLAVRSLGRSGPLVFSPTQVLASSWYDYKKTYVDPVTFRTVDTQRGSVTTSEGQSYTMLRAVWQGDETTFDNTWHWTLANLAHPSDHLFSWIWGTRPNGSQGILTEQSGENSASDADTDTALALVFAYARWQDPSYLAQARAIIEDIWNNEVVVIQGKPYMAADNLEKTSKSSNVVVNPSYFSPAAYHIFASVDATHDWEALRANSYAVLAQAASSPLDGTKSAGLPPDWILVDRATGALRTAPSANHDTSFGFDALRVPFRVTLDAEWFHNPDALNALKRFSFLSSAYAAGGQLSAAYGHDGTPVLDSQSAAMYGGTLGYFMITNPEAASEIYDRKLLSLYDANTGGWSPTLSYYDNNWAWFGIALYNRQLPNLAAELPPRAFIE